MIALLMIHQLVKLYFMNRESFGKFGCEAEHRFVNFIELSIFSISKIARQTWHVRSIMCVGV